MKKPITREMAEALLARAGERYVPVVQHGTLEVEYYRPLKTDPQKPHTRDEVYFVVAGRGTFVHGSERIPFGPGAVFHVPAGEPHRFEDFSDDFATWAVFAHAK